MARIRTIKPEFFTSLRVAELKPVVRLTFIGLWTHVDDEGRCVDDARLVKAAVSPLERTVAAIEADLKCLVRHGLVHRYEVAGRGYLQVVGWAEHQRINRPTKSKFPAPDGVRPHVVLTEPSLSPHPRKGTGNGREGNGSVVASSSQSSNSTRELDEDGLTRIRQAIGSGCTKAHARKSADFILAKAPTDVRNPVAYVIKAIRDEPELYRYHRGNPTKATECPTHAGEWADACRACALDAKLGDLA